MSTTHIRKRLVAGAVGAAIAGMAAPALLILGAGTAQATPEFTEQATTIVTERPGHVLIQVKPQLVSPPHIWGPFDSPLWVIRG
jgi:hypothetical protein